MRYAESINPQILAWARETAGLSVEEAAARLGFKDTAKATAVEKLAKMEAGETKPTRPQLLKIAATYRRPLTTFYMAAPPPLADRGEDFRAMPGDISRREAALLDALLRDIRARQDMVKAILEEDEDQRRVAFVGSMQVDENVTEKAEVVRATLGYDDYSAMIAGGWNTPDNLFDELRARVEDLGVFVILAGNLGSHHSKISEKVFRGFAIADEIAPFIVINEHDAVAARSFTLIHELVHLFLGQTGISAAPSPERERTPRARIERFCNDVAGEFLLPEASLQTVPPIDDVDEAIETIRMLADGRGVSEAMVAYRFWRTGRIGRRSYREIAAHLEARWRAFQADKRKKSRDDAGGGPSYYVVRRHRLGRPLVNLIGRTLKANEITHTKAAKILGVKPSSVGPLVADSRVGGKAFI